MSIASSADNDDDTARNMSVLDDWTNNTRMFFHFCVYISTVSSADDNDKVGSRRLDENTDSGVEVVAS